MKHSCGGATIITRGPDSRRLVDVAMNTSSRERRCVACNSVMATVEVESSELSDLRRRAYLYELSKVELVDAAT